MRQHVYLSPGMFGFGRLGSYTYFAHVERALAARFAAAGHELVPHVIEDLPTASIRRRATRLAEIIAQTSGSDPLHLLGHSTGGVDARLVASPATVAIDTSAWSDRLRSVTTMNTPHRGTPLASFFATANGQRVLAALSVLTFAGLSLGAQPLAAASAILGFLRGGERTFPFKVAILDRAVDSVVGIVDAVRTPEVRSFLAAIHDDQGSLLQLSPEAMDLVAAGFADREGVRYQSTVSMAPAPKPQRWLASLGHPWRTVSLSLFFALHRITGRTSPRYPCAALRGTTPWAGDATEALLATTFGAPPALDASDGIVPLRSQLWGDIAWAGHGDHLDVLGHHRDDRRLPIVPRHRDWLTSGSNFGAKDFERLMDAIAKGMLRA